MNEESARNSETLDQPAWTLEEIKKTLDKHTLRLEQKIGENPWDADSWAILIQECPSHSVDYARNVFDSVLLVTEI